MPKLLYRKLGMTVGPSRWFEKKVREPSKHARDRVQRLLAAKVPKSQIATCCGECRAALRDCLTRPAR